MKKCMAFFLACLLTAQTCTLAANAVQIDTAADYEGTILAAINTNYDDWTQTFSAYCKEGPTAAWDRTDASAQSEDGDWLDAAEDDLEPLSAAQAAQKQASLGKTAENAAKAADYHAGDRRTVHSSFRAEYSTATVTVECVYVGTNCTVWNEVGVAYFTEKASVSLGERFDETIPRELALFGDKRIDADGDGKIALFVHEMDSGYGGYFSSSDLVDALGRIGNVWLQTFGNGNACDCIHLSSAALSTAVHEYQHYIQCSYRYAGKNNLTYIGNKHESFINEGFSGCAEYLFSVGDRSYSFADYARETQNYSLVNWSFDSGAYSISYVFCQYLRTRYAQLVGDWDSEFPGVDIYKTIMEIRANKRIRNTLSVAADLLYPTAQYPQLKTADSRCRQLLADFWLAVLCKEPSGIYGFNGEEWAEKIAMFVSEGLPEDGSQDIRSAMAAYYFIRPKYPSGVLSGTACVTKAGKDMVFAAVDGVGKKVVYDWNNGQWAPEEYLRLTRKETVEVFNDVYFPGKAFRGWSLDPQATAASYTGGEEIPFAENGPTVLYAVWADAKSLPLGQTVRLPDTQKHCLRFVPESSGYYILSAQSNVQTEVCRDGTVLSPEWEEWDEYEEGTFGWRYFCFYMQAGVPYDFYVKRWLRSDSLRLDAVMQQYALRYNVNLSDVEYDRQIHGKTAYTLAEMEEEIRDIAMVRGLAFAGWAETVDAVQAQYVPGDLLSLDADKTLYAVWQPIADLPADGQSTFETSEDKTDILFLFTPDSDGTYLLHTSGRDDCADPLFWELCTVYDTEGNELFSYSIDFEDIRFALQEGKTYIFKLQIGGAPQRVWTVDVALQKTDDASCARLLLRAVDGVLPAKYVALTGRFVYTVPRLTPVSDDGYKFAGWSEDPYNPNARVYHAGDKIELLHDRVLFSVWERPQKTNAVNKVFIQFIQACRLIRQMVVLYVRGSIKLLHEDEI